MPGERQYIVTGEEEEIDQSATTAKVVEGLPEGQPWYIRLVASISEAGKDGR
jgi:hypothetical protein